MATMNIQTLSVTLPSDTLYVSGTVNGTAVTWTNTEGNTWGAAADRASNDIYLVELTIIDSQGQSTTASLTLFYGLHLITDRTGADVERVKALWTKGWAGMTDAEKEEWLSGLKGAYNAADLNRVGAAMEYLEGRLTGLGIAVSISPKLDWAMPDIPTPEQMENYLADVGELRGALTVPDGTPPVPEDMEKLTYTEANDIEEILEITDELITNTTQAWFYSNDLYAGEV